MNNASEKPCTHSVEIDIPDHVCRALTMMATEKGMTVERYIEELLVRKAKERDSNIKV